MRILGIAGKKQCGKDTLGKMIMEQVNDDVRSFWFATPMKQLAHFGFGVPEEFLWGTDDQRNQKTHIRWRDLPHFERYVLESEVGIERGIQVVRKADEFLTGRQLLQEIGEFLFEKTSRPWSRYFLDELAKFQRSTPNDYYAMALVLDIRRPMEITTIKELGGKVIYLTRDIYEGRDTHVSETSLSPEKYDHSNFDLVIDNQNLSPVETWEQCRDFLVGWHHDMFTYC